MPACNEAKVKTKHAKRNTGNLKVKFPNFGDCITSDTWHATGKHPTAGHAQERSAVTTMDIGTDFTGAHTQATKDADEATKALLHFIGPNPQRLCKEFFSDRAPELIKAAARHGISHNKSMPYRHKQNSVIERRNQQVQEGMRTVLANSGVALCLWTYAAKHWCHIHNVTTKGGQDKSPWERRFGTHG